MKKGFTIIELMIVVAIIAIMAAIAIPQYQRYNNPKAYAQMMSEQSRARFERSIVRDPQTGCQYLQGDRGTLTPRIDAQGNPICN